MSTRTTLSVKDIHLDTSNIRLGLNICKTDEECIKRISDLYFPHIYSITKKICEVGFLEGENILVQKNEDNSFTVKEGNCRISVLKIILSTKKHAREYKYPEEILKLKNRLDTETIKELKKIPCIVYDLSEKDQKKLKAEIANRHLSSKTNSAPRLPWPSYYKTKAEREIYNQKSDACDLLERYFYHHPGQEQTMGITYNLTVLEDFIPHLATYLGYQSKTTMIVDYPNPSTQKPIEHLILGIFNKDIKGISQLSNRRDNAGTFLQKNIIKTADNPSDVTEKPQPTTTLPKEFDTDAYVHNFPTPPRKPRSPNIYTTSAQCLIDATATLVKPNNCAKELKSLLKSNNFHVNAAAFLLRCIFEYAIKTFCKTKGIHTANKMIGSICTTLFSSKTFLPDHPELHKRVQEISTRELESLNKFIHSDEFEVTRTDLKTILTNLTPSIEKLFSLAATRQNVTPSSRQQS